MNDKAPSILPSVLVVEDDVLILMDTVAILTDAGFRTYESGSAEQAIEIIAGGADIGLVFTDNRIAGAMDGQTLAVALKGRWPHIAVVITSGLSIDADLPPGVTFLPKPYSAADLVACIRNVGNERLTSVSRIVSLPLAFDIHI